MRDVAMPNRSPIAVQTPNACHSINCLNRFMPLNYNIQENCASIESLPTHFLGNFAKLFYTFDHFLNEKSWFLIWT